LSTQKTLPIIYLVSTGSHFHAVLGAASLGNARFFCNYCLQWKYNNTPYHRCLSPDATNLLREKYAKNVEIVPENHENGAESLENDPENPGKRPKAQKEKPTRQKRQKKNIEFIEGCKVPNILRKWGVYDFECELIDGKHSVTHAFAYFPTTGEELEQLIPNSNWMPIPEEAESLVRGK
jgi:hypothetical protein